MAHQEFDFSEFVSVRYYQGTHGCTGSSDRYAYYGMSGTPTLMFNGTYRIVGAGTAAATGDEYKDIIRSRYYDASPIKIDIDSWEPTTGAVSVTVTMYSTTANLTNENFHIVLFENDVAAGHTEVARDIYNDTISLTGVGNTASFNTTFTLDPTWNTSNLGVIAFVQKQDQEILQTKSSDPQPTSKVRAMVPFDRTSIGPSTTPDETSPVTVMNVGSADTYTIEVVIDEAPPGWTVAFRDSGGTLHTSPLGFSLTADEQTTFTALVTPTSPGYIRYHFEVTSASPQVLEIPFVYITDDVDALLVDDDGGYDYEDYFIAALDATGLSYGVWNLSSGKLNDAVADAIDLLIWNIGLGYPSLDVEDRAFLAQHLDNGKSLFITGQDIGWDLNDPGSGNADPTFYEGYLHAEYISDDVNWYYVDGVPGDPISDGLVLHIEGGDGASNQEYPSWIEPIGDGVKFFNYQGQTWGAGVRSIDSTSGAFVAYLAFGYEAIDNPTDRSALMAATIYWLQGGLFADDFESNNTSAWSNVLP